MKKIQAFCFIFLLLFQPAVSFASDQRGPYSSAPITNKGKKWRIGYYEGGAYVNYPINLIRLAEGLAELGWFKKHSSAIPQDPVDSKSVWHELGKTDSDFIEFVDEAYWSAGWDKGQRVLNRTSALKYLNEKKLDMIIAMGTWAGQDLATNEHSVPTMIVSTSDPVKAKIIDSSDDSGFDHVHAKCDPTRYLRQVRLFHNMVGFKKLGLVYENSVDGRTYGAIDDVERIAAERAFEIVSCEAPFSGVDKAVSTQALIKCHEELAPKVDALYITVHRGVDSKRMAEILEPLLQNKIPTFYMRGPKEVKHGVMMSISRGGFVEVGRYHANVAAKIFNGAKARDLDQVFEDPKQIAINMKTAEKINFVVPPIFLKIADEIYKDIHVAD